MQKFDVVPYGLTYESDDFTMSVRLTGAVYNHPLVGEKIRVVEVDRNIALKGCDCIVQSITMKTSRTSQGYRHWYCANAYRIPASE